ncbi:MAG: hypothetical protein C4558_04925 [Dehalococcoidia bacterium]|nr:MAG: hypothetical protein C4558_04925 [Dehalococcoidia bacterium]
MTATLHPTQRQRPRGLRPNRRGLALAAVLFGGVAWAIAWGAHAHTSVPQATGLAAAAPARTVTVSGAGGRLDLSGVSARPGEVLDLVVTDAPGAHAFVVQGSQPGSEYLVRARDDGTTLIRLKVPPSGQVGLLCTTPGHENLHGNIIIGVTE